MSNPPILKEKREILDEVLRRQIFALGYTTLEAHLSGFHHCWHARDQAASEFIRANSASVSKSDAALVGETFKTAAWLQPDVEFVIAV